MIHLRRLIESHDYFSRILDQSLILSKNTNDSFHVQACRGNGYALIYIPYDMSVTIDLSKMGASVHAYWFNPRTSEYSFMGQFSRQPQHTFMPNGRPLQHADWVLEIKEVQ